MSAGEIWTTTYESNPAHYQSGWIKLLFIMLPIDTNDSCSENYMAGSSTTVSPIFTPVSDSFGCSTYIKEKRREKKAVGTGTLHTYVCTYSTYFNVALLHD